MAAWWDKGVVVVPNKNFVFHIGSSEGLVHVLRYSNSHIGMVLYSVYKARFFTKKGTCRYYVGYTGNASRREDRLQLGEVAWLKPRRPGSLTMEVLHEDLATKFVARAQEALAAGRAINVDPDHVRGGPWLALRLSKADRAEVAAVAKCKCLASLPLVAAELGPRSRLAMHLKNLKFESVASSTGSGARAVVQVCRSGARTSGARTSGTRTSGARTSGARTSGSPGKKIGMPGEGQSGAVARFHRLPQLKRPSSAA